MIIDTKELIETANDYVTQDNLSTVHPIGFYITEEFLEVSEDCEDVIRCEIDGDYIDFETRDEVIEDIKERNPDVLTSDEIVYLDQYYDSVTSMKIERRASNKQELFLTKASLERHMKKNAHRYNNPKSYLVHIGWRNPSLKSLVSLLYSIATVPIEDWNEEAKRYYLEMKKES